MDKGTVSCSWGQVAPVRRSISPLAAARGASGSWSPGRADPSVLTRLIPAGAVAGTTSGRDLPSRLKGPGGFPVLPTLFSSSFLSDAGFQQVCC